MRTATIISIVCMIVLPIAWIPVLTSAAPIPRLRVLPGSVKATVGPIRWGYYVDYARSSWETLQAHVGDLDMVSAYYYKIDGAGQISGEDDSRATALVKSAGIPLLPMIQNSDRYDQFSPVLQDPTLRRQTIDDLTALVVNRGYDGIHIDFEALNGADRPFLTRFMAELAERLRPRGKLVTMALGAKPREMTSGWAGAYDYAGLAPYLDYAVIMAYDYSTGTGRPGSTSPIEWVLQVADYAASQIPPNKLLLGLALWAYDWNAMTTTDPAESMSYTDAAALLAQTGATGGYSDIDQSAWLQYTRDGAPRIVWYESRRSVESKMNAALRRGLAGVAIWRLGHEDPEIWPVFKAHAAVGGPAISAPGDSMYFAATRHTVRGAFLQYFATRGGLNIFGFPRTDEIVENGRVVQYFQRARMEWHPESPPEWRVQLGLLGDEIGGRGTAASPNMSAPNVRYFPETGHNVANAFLTYFTSNGGVDIFGYPKTEEMSEGGLTVQYFQRVRMEWHPENPPEWRVQLGLLGDELLMKRGVASDQ
ncbi:MAG: peptidoglycan hydrolase [Chloroflexota bacterium]|nr:MAG: peptidoglycan hydrolase [Chloroflexota bacterium]